MSTLQDLLPRLLAFGGRAAVLSIGETGALATSHAELSRQAARLADGLLQSGLKRGEPVAILAPNRTEWIIACLAIVAAGGLLVPLDAHLPPNLLAHEITDSGACGTVTGNLSA